MSILTDGEREVRPRQPWIGLVWVSPRRGNDALKGALGAYVNVVALAESPEDYRLKATDHLNENGFDVLEIEDIEELGSRMRPNGSPSSEILQLAEDISGKNPVGFGAFHSYRVDDESS